ncbi:MAG TPA: hypothetical protein VL475_11385, partial [Planctomycetaceae bacterium]|nr:hypothetical protein [Planctomycetaceae bacterium]
LGTPDLVLEMPAAFDVPADGPDIYRNFALPTNLAEDRWVKAIEFRPSARGVVHHSLFFGDTSGAARAQDGKDGQPGFPGLGAVFTFQAGDPLSALTGGLGGWVPGSTPAFLPEGMAYPLRKGSDLLLQTHFHPNGVAQTEKSTIALYFGPKPAREIASLQVPAFFGVRANIDIPAGVPDYKVRGSFTLPADVDAVGVSAHAHYLARGAKLTATLPDGQVRILLWIRDWDFNWQDQYQFADLLPLPKGTRMDGELIYDNSANNIRNPNSPPKRVRWGEQSTDEMGSLILSVVPRQAGDIEALRVASVVYLLTPVPQVGNRPLFISSGMVDAASGQPGAVTPGKIVLLYGSRLGPDSLTGAAYAGDGKIATSLAGSELLFDGVAAPLLYTSSGQLAAIVPYALDGQAGTQVQVRNGPLLSDRVAMPVTPVAPSIFSVDYTGSGQGAIMNEDGRTVNGFANPAARGSIVSIFATGEGQTDPGGIDGLIAAAAPYPKPARAVQVRMGGVPAEVLYAGAAPNQVAGLLQVNARVPSNLPPGEAAVEIQVGETKSQPGITIAVK